MVGFSFAETYVQSTDESPTLTCSSGLPYAFPEGGTRHVSFSKETHFL